MKLAKVFGTDKSKEQEGVWIEMGEGGAIKVARMGNPSYSKKFQKLTKPYKQAIRRETLSDEIAERILVDSMAEHILLDWKGIEDENGNEIPYSLETAKKLLSDLKDFRNYISEMATSIENFKEEEDEGTEKN